MHIAMHIGANCTDGDMLVRSLTKNASGLEARGVSIPGLSKYRRLIRETIQNLGGSAPLPETRNVLIQQISDLSDAKRLVMSNSAFICLPIRIFEAGEFYGLTTMKIRALTQLFPNDALEIHFALRNPATFIPAAFETVRNKSFDGFMNGVDPRRVQWSDVIARIQAAAPSAKLTVWCNEDIPLIWGDILRAMTGVDAAKQIAGEYDMLSAIMTAEGMARFASYMTTNPPDTPKQKRRIISAFLDKYAIPGEIEEEINLPGWDDRMVEELTVLYEADVDAIAKTPGVTFLAP